MKKVMFLLMALPMLAGMFVSCSATKADAGQLEGKWNIVDVKGRKIQQEIMPFMEFNTAENRVHGNAGCNIFNTSMKLDPKDNSLFTFTMATSTMMACPDMELESIVFKALDEIQGVKAGKTSNQMILFDQNKNDVITLEKTDK